MSVDAIAALLGPNGGLSKVLDGYEVRPQQLEMAQAVAHALATRRHLVVEAGTGTGKTLAYLAPAALSGQRVVISTATKTLQDQLVEKDVPLLEAALGHPVEAAVLKGRSNYVCHLKLEAFDEAPRFERPEDAVAWKEFRPWALKTDDGDRAGAPVSELWSGWHHVTTTSDACLGGRCPHFDACFVTRARQRAEASRVIIVNHALFFADLSLKARGGDGLRIGVLPAYDAVVFDEAHALEDVATEYFGRSASWGRYAALSSDALKALPGDDERHGPLAGLALTLKDTTDAFFEAARDALRLSPGQDTRLSERALSALRPPAAPLLETLGALTALCEEGDEALGFVHRRASEAAEALDAVLRRDDPTQVYWAEAKGRSPSLRCAPISVAALLDTHLLSEVSPVVFTSATLAAGAGDDARAFGFVAERFGLPEGSFDARRLDSPFDFAQQAVLYAPSDLPEPSAPGWTEAFAELVAGLVPVTKGRAFVLFTSHRQLDAVHGLLQGRLKYPLLKQGELSRASLLKAFIETPSVLFGAATFWEGVDVPGPALSLVIIDRLPFAPPGDPLEAARIEAVRQAGGSPFDAYQVPKAALALRQGFGRLVRTRADVGVVALGDVRVHTKRYGKVFLESLPPARRVNSLAEVKQAFGELSSR